MFVYLCSIKITDMEKTTLKTMHGQIVDTLLEGGKIIAKRFDGFDFHILVEMPKGGEWRYRTFETNILSIGSTGLSHMSSYNHTPKQALYTFNKEYIESRVQKGENGHKYSHFADAKEILKTIAEIENV